MNGAPVRFVAGAQGSGRSAQLMVEVKTYLAQLPGAHVVVVDPCGSWSADAVAALGPAVTVLREAVAMSPGVFGVLAVLVAVSPGLLVVVDDAEQLSDDREAWSALAVSVAAHGGRLVVNLPAAQGFGCGQGRSPVRAVRGGRIAELLAL